MKVVNCELNRLHLTVAKYGLFFIKCCEYPDVEKNPWPISYLLQPLPKVP